MICDSQIERLLVNPSKSLLTSAFSARAFCSSARTIAAVISAILPPAPRARPSGPNRRSRDSASAPPAPWSHAPIRSENRIKATDDCNGRKPPRGQLLCKRGKLNKMENPIMEKPSSASRSTGLAEVSLLHCWLHSGLSIRV